MTALQTFSDNSHFLRQALRGNALFSGLSGLVSLLAASSLANFTGIAQTAVSPTLGLILIPYGLLLFWAARQPVLDVRLAKTAVFLDMLWVIGSLILLLGNWLPLTLAGKWTIGLLAEAVATFAILQTIGLRRLTH